ncbi:MAG: DUF4231 domain-containing protein [Rhodoplanes sp.]
MAGFPALFRSADEASDRKQRLYLGLVGVEYGLLLLAAIFSMDFAKTSFFYMVYAGLFFISIAILLTRALLKPQQEWYRCRALAESVKTLTWRYMMRADPFGDAPKLAVARAAFREQLHQLFTANKATAQMIAHDWSADDQITKDMDDFRALPLEERKARYEAGRIRDQRTWYAQKARYNRRQIKIWVSFGVICYVLAALLALGRILLPNWELWPIEPVIVIACSVIGWMQIKKFSELAAAYTVTAHEIGLISPKLDAVQTESELSDFVNEAEQAFSREHTMWIARRTTKGAR